MDDRDAEIRELMAQLEATKKTDLVCSELEKMRVAVTFSQVFKVRHSKNPLRIR